MGPKIGGRCPLFGKGAGSTSNTKSPELRSTSIPSGILMHPAVCPQQKCAENLGAPPPFWEKGAGSPSNTKSPGPRPTSIPSGILIHAALWRQQIWAENWGLCPFGGGGAGSPFNTMCPEPYYLRAKFHLDPSNRLATVHCTDRTEPTHRQTTDGPIA